MAQRSAPPGDVDPSSSLPMWGEDDLPAPPSSRLCVKNIPKHLTLERLREHFAERGEVTDAKIMKTGDGKSRQMAFVGYKSEEDAVKALEYFNNTFVDTSKIQVEYARAVKSSTLPRPWSKHSQGSSAHGRANAPEPDLDAPEPLDPDRFIGVRELKKMKNTKKHAAERELEQMIADDPKLAEFMELMAPRSKQKIWDNADGNAFGAANAGDADLAANETPTFEDDESDDDEYQDLDDDEGKAGAAKGVKKRPNAIRRENKSGNESDSFDVSSSDDDDDEESDDESGSESEEVDTLAADSNVSDMDYLKKRAGALSDTESEEEEEENEEDESDEDDEMEDATEDDKEPTSFKKEAHTVTADDMEAIAETGRVFARNLPFTATEEEVAEFFRKFGALTAVHVLVDKTTRRSKGLAYVTYALPENGVAAMEALDGSIFQGRLIHLIPAKRPPNAMDTLGGVGRVDGVGGVDDEDGEDDDNTNKQKNKNQTEAERESNFKADKEKKLKQDAGSNKAAWNSLFMRQDTVAAAVAAKYNVSKRDLLESGDSDVAVRLALGEAQIIADTKAQLEDCGVEVDVLVQSASVAGANTNKGMQKTVKRSDIAILLKNLPYEAEEHELKTMCERFGNVSRLVLPDTKTIAIVEFLEPNDARKAFKGLAYKRYKHVPIYVEWAPVGVFTGDAPKTNKKQGNNSEGPRSVPRADTINSADEKLQVEKDDDEDELSSRLFVKGLSFQTSEAALRAHFLRAASTASGRVLAANVATQRGPGGATLSRGFGFVEFDTPAVARAAKRAMQGKALEGRALKLELSSTGGNKDSNTQGANDSKTISSKVPEGYSANKLVVRNVAFEATRRDIQKLFNPFGVLKSCRLPKKFDGAHRGFAFVELSTQREASAALDALKGTHLYGRRLTIERAEEDDNVENVREKTAVKYERGIEGEAAARGENAMKKRRM